MNISFLRKLGLAAVLICARFAQAGPSELNFQGVLLDASGNGVTGTRVMTVKLYDAAIGGNLLYTEDLGNVAVNKGVYSFNFGTNGTSNAKVTETVATTDGTLSSFQKILSNTNVVAGSVTVADGTYTWDQVNGSSDGGVKFDASYSTSLKRITVTYYNGAPTVGKTIAVTYRSPSSGVLGVLSNEKDPWLEISLAGVPQSTRQKLVAAPYSLRAARVDEESYQELKEIDLPIKRALAISSYNYEHTGVTSRFPIGVPSGTPQNLSAYNWESKTIIYDLPFYVKEIVSLTINYTIYKLSVSGYSSSFFGRIDLSLLDSTDQALYSFAFPRQEASSSTTILPINKVVPAGEAYRISIIVQPGNDSGSFQTSWGGGNINSIKAKFKVPKTMALP